MEKSDKDEQREIRKVLYDGSFKFASGLIGLLLTVLWWGITHQLSSLESQIKEVFALAQQIRADQSSNYAADLQRAAQLDINTKRLDRLEDWGRKLEEKVTRLDTMDNYRNGKR